jgi:hypothetical protein
MRAVYIYGSVIRTSLDLRYDIIRMEILLYRNPCCVRWVTFTYINKSDKYYLSNLSTHQPTSCSFGAEELPPRSS